MFKKQRHDVTTIDLMLSKSDSLEVCSRIRQTSTPKALYILILTTKGEEIDLVIGLSIRADNYLIKPLILL
jgi:two-component system alkaline phosphatase synthesis response regulator PhoP